MRSKGLCVDKTAFYGSAKLIVMLLVVLGHCLSMYTPDGAVPVVCGSRLLGGLRSVVYGFHIPAFFMLSGAVYAVGLQKGKYGEFRPFARKKAFRLMVPYFCVAVVCVLPVVLLLGMEPVSLSNIIECVLNVILGARCRHLWFLYSLFLIFLLAYPCRRFLSKRNSFLFLLVSFTVSITARHLPFTVLAYFQLGNVLFYQFFFFLGVFADLCFKEVRALLRSRPQIVIISFALLFLRCVTGLWIFGDYVYAFCGIAVLLEIALLCGDAMAKNRFFRFLSRDAYGMYLFHAMLVYLIYYAFSSVAINAWLLTAIAFVVSCAASVLLTELCRRVHLGFFLGEK